MRVKGLTQEHNTRSPPRARTQSTCSGVKRTNLEATGRKYDITCLKIKGGGGGEEKLFSLPIIHINKDKDVENDKNVASELIFVHLKERRITFWLYKTL